MVYCHIHCSFFAVDKPKFIHTNIYMHTYTPLKNNTSGMIILQTICEITQKVGREHVKAFNPTHQMHQISFCKKLTL